VSTQGLEERVRETAGGRMSSKLLALASAAAVAVLVALASSGSAAKDGDKDVSARDILEKSQDKQFPKNAISEITMILISKGGQQRERKILTKRKDYGNGEAKSVAYFLSPADVKGTAFLVWQHKSQENDLFIYLPALKKIRRIASDQKHQSFMGSDFSYSDMEQRNLDEADHKILREEKVGESACWVIESVPKASSDSQYGKILSWIRKEDYNPQKIEFYDKNKALMKVMTVQKIGPVGEMVLPLHFTMDAVQKDHKTEIIVDSMQFNADIPDSEFTQQRIQR